MGLVGPNLGLDGPGASKQEGPGWAWMGLDKPNLGLDEPNLGLDELKWP